MFYITVTASFIGFTKTGPNPNSASQVIQDQLVWGAHSSNFWQFRSIVVATAGFSFMVSARPSKVMKVWDRAKLLVSTSYFKAFCIYNSCYLTQQILAWQLLENLCWGLHIQDLHQSLTKFESICMASLFKLLVGVLCFNVLSEVYCDKSVKVLLVGQ